MMEREVESGKFTIKLEFPPEIEIGHTGRFKITIKDEDGTLTDADSISLKVYSKGTLTTTETPTHDSTGKYYVDYAVPTSEDPGVREAEWSGSAGGVDFAARFTFLAKRWGRL